MPKEFGRPYVSKGTYVAGEGPIPADLMFIGEGPGRDEDKWGRPFVGKSGKELNRYLWQSCHRTRTSVYVTNLVKYRVPDDGDPAPEDIARDRAELERELLVTNPEVIVTLGRWSTRHFLGDVDMESCHGIPRMVDGGRCLVPIIHPAAGLHSTEFQALIYWDFEQLGKLLSGKEVEWAGTDDWPNTDYRQRDGWTMVGRTQAVDTEGSTAKPWCLSHAGVAGAAVCNRIGGTDFQHVVLHNALHDIGVLRAMGASYESFDDTMLMAYLLCVEPQGLKALALRHCGMVMDDYQDVVRGANLQHADQYLRKVVSWLNKRLSSEYDESLMTTSPGPKKRTSAKGGRKSSRTASRKK